MEALLVIFGWLLGLLSPPIAERLERPRKARRLAGALYEELRDLRFTLAIVAFRLGLRLGLLDAEFLEKLRPVIGEGDANEEDRAGYEALRRSLEMNQEQLAAWTAREQALHSTLNPVPYSLPFLEAQVPNLDLFSVETQQRLLQIRAQLGFYDGDVDFFKGQLAMTFDSAITGANRAGVEENLQRGLRNLANRAVYLVGLISRVLPLLKKS